MSSMSNRRWWAAWIVASLLAGTALVRWDIAQRREAFQAEARTAHRLLSQRAAELDATLATLALLAPAPDAEARLPALVPQVLRVMRGGDVAAEARSRASGDAVVAAFDPERRRFTLLRAATPAAVALEVDIDRWLPGADWPFRPDGAVAVRLVLDGRSLTLAAGRPALGVTPGYRFAKRLGPLSQPFELQVQRATGPEDWPWAGLVALAALLAALTAAAAAAQRQRLARARAEELLRLDRLARLNTLGEMGAGLAHELNQPLTAVLASAQAARRMLDDDAPPLLREALDQTAAQARRAADVVARLRRRVEQPAAAPELQPVDLRAAAQQALVLLEPELRAASVRTTLEGPACAVLADPVALAQILHNLLRNAMQAMAAEPAEARGLALTVAVDGERGLLSVRDHGPGLAPEVLARLFQPFTSTKADGLGLGLSLSETLAVTMGGRLTAQNVAPRGAEFRLALPRTTA
jgi:signal transduction histidine kinase